MVLPDNVDGVPSVMLPLPVMVVKFKPLPAATDVTVPAGILGKDANDPSPRIYCAVVPPGVNE